MNFSGGGAWLGDKVLCLKCMSKLSPGLVGMAPDANHSPRFLPSQRNSQMRSIGPGKMRTNCTVCSSGRVAKSFIASSFDLSHVHAIKRGILGKEIGALWKFATQSGLDQVQHGVPAHHGLVLHGFGDGAVDQS